MPLSIKHLTVPFSIVLLFGAGCSSDEAEQGVKKLEEETENAAKETTEKSKELTEKVKQETPGIIQNMMDTYKESEQELKDNTLQKGEQATVQNDAYLALTPEAYDELYQLIEINDIEGVDKIVSDNQVIEIKQGSEVEIVEREIRRMKVKLKDSREEGYLPSSLLEPEK